MIVPFANKVEPDLIETMPGLMGFLTDRMRESLPEVFVFESVLIDVERMVADVQRSYPYKPPYDTAFTLEQSICCGEGSLVRCGRPLLGFYGFLHGFYDLSKQPLSEAKLVHLAIITLGVEGSLTFSSIQQGPNTDAMMIASKVTFEEKYGARVRVVVHEPVRTTASPKRRRGAK
ncbi:MAG: hypothetical protein EOQ52_07045 [Mesorhizobium sp.]|uniref:hypothetical protein n=1 Tax=Mesorhizobium sp. TaxID=1871066 RepID=UPI000FE4D97D|nr:hypothetical protein [Mesorhizobium sp.]RWB91175.1 MAG: hypothetical protein EOQ52_07045 [Mesorhizobium sp.]